MNGAGNDTGNNYTNNIDSVGVIHCFSLQQPYPA